MKKSAAETYRDIDFTRARRGAVTTADPGKTKISIRLDNRVLEHFRSIVEAVGAGNYQTLINDALVAYIQQESVLEAVRQVVREEVAGSRLAHQGGGKPRQTHRRRAVVVG
jgi:uncharacterized protein (DUF4415 family)